MGGARKPGRKPGTAKTGGRPKGGKNKATLAREQAIVDILVAEKLTPEEAETLEPLTVMLKIMRSRYIAGDEIGALVAAAACAPYRHARLSSSDVRVTHSDADLSDAEVQTELEALRLKKAAAKVLN